MSDKQKRHSRHVDEWKRVRIKDAKQPVWNMSHSSKTKQLTYCGKNLCDAPLSSNIPYRKHFRSCHDIVECVNKNIFCYFWYSTHSSYVSVQMLPTNNCNECFIYLGISHLSYKQDLIGVISYFDNKPRIWMIWNEFGNKFPFVYLFCARGGAPLTIIMLEYSGWSFIFICYVFL